MTDGRDELVSRLREAVDDLAPKYGGVTSSDENVERELHHWLDGDDSPLDWVDPKHVTPDEWFFITTLCI